jgi:N6-adenosine-specific RNA methylase IME4
MHLLHERGYHILLHGGITGGVLQLDLVKSTRRVCHPIPGRRTGRLSERKAFMKQELAHFDAIKVALQKAASVDEAKGIRDRAEALRIYAKQSGQSLEVLNRCAEIKLSAERRAGEILLDMEKNKGARGKGVRFRDESAPTLAELGISQVQSHRWQKIAGIPVRLFDVFIRDRTREGKEITSVSVLRLANELNRRARGIPEDVEEMDPLLHGVDFTAGERFSTIVMDPPWDQLGRHTGDLWNLPIQAMCGKNAHLYLCLTNSSLEQGFELLRFYGFRYATCLTWCKSSTEGAGSYYPSSTEHILLGVRGTVELKRRDLGTWFQWPWGHIHSEKPDRFYEFVMSCSPGPYAVLFSRKQRPGWTCANLDIRTVATVRNQRVWAPFAGKGLARQGPVIEVQPSHVGSNEVHQSV